MTWRRRVGEFVSHDDVSFVLWHSKEPKQRIKMLASLVHVPAQVVKTEWFLKLDTDAPAIRRADWIDTSWFKKSVFVASPWGYTKPASSLDVLNEWADEKPEFAGTSRIIGKIDKLRNRVRYPRITSWLMFSRTSFAKRCASLCDGWTLPVPSQDTFMWYVAQRLRLRFKKVRFKNLGWGHYNKRNLIERCRSSLSA